MSNIFKLRIDTDNKVIDLFQPLEEDGKGRATSFNYDKLGKGLAIVAKVIREVQQDERNERQMPTRPSD